MVGPTSPKPGDSRCEALEENGWTSGVFDAFSSQLGPVWTRGRGADGELEVAFYATDAHTNGHLGTVHGGLLMTFADVSLGMKVGEVIGGPRCTTVSLQVQFVSAGQVGDFLVCCPEVVRRTRNLMFMRGLITVGDRPVATAEGIWKIWDAPAADC